MNVRSGDELDTLVPPGCCEYSPMTRDVVPSTTPHGDIIQVIKDGYAKRIDRSRNGFDRGLRGMGG